MGYDGLLCLEDFYYRCSLFTQRVTWCLNWAIDLQFYVFCLPLFIRSSAVLERTIFVFPLPPVRSHCRVLWTTLPLPILLHDDHLCGISFANLLRLEGGRVCMHCRRLRSLSTQLGTGQWWGPDKFSRPEKVIWSRVLLSSHWFVLLTTVWISLTALVNRSVGDETAKNK